MKLTKNLRAKIVSQFKEGYSIGEIFHWYEKSYEQIEDVIRDALNEQTGKLQGLCDVASTADLPRGVRDAAHQARLTIPTSPKESE